MKSSKKPYIIMLGSYLGLIILGTLLLSLPFSQKSGVNVSFLDTIFISSSAVTLTGLTTLNIMATYTLAGRIIIILLVELSAITLITLVVFILQILGVKMGLSAKFIIKENISSSSISNIYQLVIQIAIFSFAIQFLGFIINLFIFRSSYPNIGQLIEVSIFHAISAYSNCGMTIISDLNQFQTNPLFVINTTFLLVIGRMGLPVIFDIVKNKRYSKLSTNTKIILRISIVLDVVGVLLIFLTNIDKGFSETFFLSMVSRSGGLFTSNLHTYSSTSIVVITLLMFIGGAPASTGGGVKVTPVYTVYKSFTSFVTKNKPMINEKHISTDYQIESFSIVVFCLLVVFLGTILVLVFDPLISISDATFEIVSAFANCGLTLGLVNEANVSVRIILITTMIVGRLGVLCWLHLLNFNKRAKDENIRYVEGEYILG